jgi:hypothetical protein
LDTSFSRRSIIRLRISLLSPPVLPLLPGVTPGPDDDLPPLLFVLLLVKEADDGAAVA